MKKKIIIAIAIAFMSIGTINSYAATAWWHHHHHDHHHHHHHHHHM